MKEAFQEAKGQDFDYPSFNITSVDKNGKLVISFTDNIIVPKDLSSLKKDFTHNGL